MFCCLNSKKERKVNMERQDYAFPARILTVGGIKSSQKDWQAAINHR